jgi:hypothetical protein
MTDIDKTIEEAWHHDVLAATLPFESWGRLTGESSAAYAAFCAYRDYGPDRNIHRAVEGKLRKAEVSAEFSPEGKTPCADFDALVTRKYRMWRAWSTQFRWRERAADYDRYLDRLKQMEKRKTIEAQEAMHRVVTKKMLEMVEKKLDRMNPEELTQGSVKEWVETAIRTEREIAGLTVSKGERDGQGGKQLEINFTPEFEGL